MLLHHPHGSFTDFRGKLVCLVHGFIFSGVEASAKPGAVQIGWMLERFIMAMVFHLYQFKYPKKLVPVTA
jgi:hypothetical protein